jgi:hypothetical protein
MNRQDIDTLLQTFADSATSIGNARVKAIVI